ncbi:hypothetical protein GCM10010464_17560 [Pseudonocardia yunnanensis]|uniref:DUF485 domain-containing protein n=1 Tax=Pseudonocardia yunnanensis TaxID=58107 RepID=A0ABW4ERL2_9PSEU
MTTFTDGVQPSVNPGNGTGSPAPEAAQIEEDASVEDDAPDHGVNEPAEHGEEDDADDADDGTDTGPGWLRDEIQRRIAEGNSTSGGRHARRESVDSTISWGYVPRHSVATPGPGAPRPGPPIGAVGPRPSGLLRQERTGAEPFAPLAWSRPQQAEPADPEPEPLAADADAAVPAALPELPARVELRADTPSAPSVVATTTATTPIVAPAVIESPAAPTEPAPPTEPTSPTESTSPVLEPDPSLSGDPLFTARTPAPGSRTRSATSPSDARDADLEAATGVLDDVESRRVRVVLAERKGVARPVRTVVDIQEGTGVGELLRSNLIGSQLAVALRFAVVAGITLGVLPLLFAMFPEIGRIEVFGVRLPWLLLGVLVYPFLFGIGLWHTRTAERVEQNFADHVQD